MHSRIYSTLIVVAGLTVWGQPLRADFLEFRVPNSSLTVVFQGRVVKRRSITLSHKLGTLYFSPGDVEIYKVPTNASLYSKMATQARKDPDGLFEAGKWAMKHALSMQFYQAVDRTLKLSPDHVGATRVKTLQEKITKPLPESPDEEEQLRAILKGGTMKIARSNHFIMLYDTSNTVTKSAIPNARPRKPRAKERLDLLEQVYETFFMTFIAEGVDLEIPQQRMKVILFAEMEDYKKFSTSINPLLSSTVGFWDPERNVSVFFDNATDETFIRLEKNLVSMRKQATEAKKKRGKGAAQIVRQANTYDIMVTAARERSDIKVVTHEATHQLAANSGLLPRHIRIPSWAHEGLATYFETPSEASWSGIGAVNASRLKMFRALAENDTFSNIDYVVTDRIFKLAASHGARLHAYAQAWALTHFLMESHFDKLMKYYAFLAQMPPDITLNPDVLLQLFNRAFGEDRQKLTVEWRAYMNDLKTDYERAIESAK